MERFWRAIMLSTLAMALGPLAGGWIFDASGGYAWLYAGSFAIGLCAAAIALAFPPVPRLSRPAFQPLDQGDCDGKPRRAWEMMSKDPAKVSDFYAKTFGWKVRHMPEINYRTVDTDAKASACRASTAHRQAGQARAVAGNMLAYILVDDLAAFRKKVRAPAARSTLKSRKFQAWASSRSSPIRGAHDGLWKAKT